MRIHHSNIAALALGCALVAALWPHRAAHAELSRDELLDWASSGMPTDELVDLVARECIDFTLDSKTLLDLAGVVPRAVLDAALDCGRGPDTGIGCQLYQAIASEPMLEGFPVVVTQVEAGTLSLMVPESGIWIEDNYIGLGGTFKAIRQHGLMVTRVEEIARGIEGVQRARIVRTTSIRVATLRATQQRGIVASCSIRRQVTINSDPPDAIVWLGGRRRGSTPLTLRVPAGTYGFSVSKKGFLAHQDELTVTEEADLDLDIRLGGVPELAVTSTPDGAVVVLAGTVVGHTPLEMTLPAALQKLEVIKPNHAPHRVWLESKAGDRLDLDLRLAPVAREDYCESVDVSGSLNNGVAALERALVSRRVRTVVPLVQVVTSTMESRLAATHVVDAARILFAPRYNKKYVGRAHELVGRELGGIAFGETATSLLTEPPGPMTITGVERKKASVKIELLADTGTRTAVILDFTRPPKDVTLSEVVDAMSVVFSRHPDFATPFPDETVPDATGDG